MKQPPQTATVMEKLCNLSRLNKETLLAADNEPA